MRIHNPARAALTALGAVAVAGVLTLTVAAPAQAHNYVISTTPAADETITEQPEEIRVTTNDALMDTATAMVVEGPDGLYYNDGCATVDGSSLVGSARLGEPGTYTVTYALTSTDGHPLSDTFKFDWAPGDGVERATGTDRLTCGGNVNDASADAGESNTPSRTEQGESLMSTVLWVTIAGVGALAALVLVMLKMRRPPAPPSE